MAGSILGVDQITKINTVYPRILRHITELLSADRSGYGLMKVHFLTEFLDTTELATIFAGLSFLAPAEKRALVRAAIFEVLSGKAEFFQTIAVDPALPGGEYTTKTEILNGQIDNQRTFTPPQFKLNVNKAESFHGERPADTPAPAPVITSTHVPKVQKVNK